MATTDDAPRERPTRLAFITTQAFSVSNFRGPLIREMVRRGVTVYALAPDYTEQTRAAVTSLGAVPVDYRISATGFNPLRDLVDLLRLWFILRRLQLDATFAYFIKPVIYGTLAAWLAGVPRRHAMIEGAGYVFNAFGPRSLRRDLLRRTVKLLYRLSLSRAHRVFLLNQEDRQLFLGERMVKAAKVQVLNGIGVDLDHYHMAPVPTAGPCFIMIARLLREKGVYEYVEAARRVKALHPRVRFLLLGEVYPNPGSVPVWQVRAWQSEGVVELPGQASDVRGWLAQASVFVLPSYYREGVPRSTQEAMAMGRAVITTDWVGCRETVEEGVNGFKLPVLDPEALSRAMLLFIELPELAARMGAASRKIAERRFDMRRTDQRILAAIGVGFQYSCCDSALEPESDQEAGEHRRPYLWDAVADIQDGERDRAHDPSGCAP